LADRGEGVNDGVEGEAVVGDTTATDDDPDEGAATGCMKEAARGEGAVEWQRRTAREKKKKMMMIPAEMRR
jgi:hypothetical protein